MKFEVQLRQANGPASERKCQVEFERTKTGLDIRVDGRLVEVDVAQVTAHTSSILYGGQSHELCVTPQPDGSLKIQDGAWEFVAHVKDPRTWRGRFDDLEAEGCQNVVAPMPGRVVRVLVKSGETVEAGQGLLVVEAMKMQNELRSPKRGIVQRLSVQEGEPVNAGQVLLSVE